MPKSSVKIPSNIITSLHCTVIINHNIYLDTMTFHPKTMCAEEHMQKYMYEIHKA